MRMIRECSKLDYLFLFGESRTAFSDLCVEQALESGGKILLMMDGDLPVGYICATKEYYGLHIAYLYTVPEKRKSGVCTELLSFFLHEMHEKKETVRLGISEQNSAFDAVVHLCNRLGFRQIDTCVVFRCKYGKKESDAWDAFMAKKGNAFRSMLLRKGYTCMPLSKASKEIENLLYNSKENDFENELDVRSFFDNKNKKLDSSLSFVVVKDDFPVAYTLVSKPDSESVVFEQMSAAKSYIRSGIIFLVFLETMAAILTVAKAGMFSRVAFTVFVDNAKSNAFLSHVLNGFKIEKHRMINYIY